MSDIASVLFYVALAGLFAHELDAVHKREWRLLFILRGLPEDRARAVFIGAHVPLLAAFFWVLSRPGAGRDWTVLALQVFMVVHAVLHWRLSGRPENEFRTTLSLALIYAPAVLSFVSLAL